MARLLIMLGILIIIIGILFPIFQKVGLGQLPGDIYVEKGNFKFYFPLTTSLLLSAFITLVLWLIHKYN